MSAATTIIALDQAVQAGQCETGGLGGADRLRRRSHLGRGGFALVMGGTKMKTAFVFPGQGSQYVGMGTELAATYPAARAVIDRARARLGDAYVDVFLNGPEEKLKDTGYTQVALFIVSMAAHAVVKGLGARADLTAGHSLGEYSALCAAGAFDFETGLRPGEGPGRGHRRGRGQGSRDHGRHRRTWTARWWKGFAKGVVPGGVPTGQLQLPRTDCGRGGSRGGRSR
jgi:acyl transferase domain-containing protein